MVCQSPLESREYARTTAQSTSHKQKRILLLAAWDGAHTHTKWCFCFWFISLQRELLPEWTLCWWIMPPSDVNIQKLCVCFIPLSLEKKTKVTTEQKRVPLELNILNSGTLRVWGCAKMRVRPITFRNMFGAEFEQFLLITFRKML